MNTPVHIGNAQCIDPASGLDTLGGICIDSSGVIADIGPHLVARGASSEQAEWRDGRGHILAPGLIDLHVCVGEPGAEHRETLASASKAAAAGGVTSFVVMPDTDPVIDTVSLVEFMCQQARNTACVKVYPAGGLTRGLEGRRMTEIGLMQGCGAVLFTNGMKAIENAGFLSRILRYATGFDALIALRPDTPTITANAGVNAGAFADLLGLPGAPAHAEWMCLARDLFLAEDSGVRLLVEQISTLRSVEMVEAARANGVDVVTTASANHLYFNELDVGTYLTHCKLSPPLRSETDRAGLVQALASGRIDAIVSAHDPRPPEDKRLPFDEAAFGAIGLETLLPCLTSLVAQGEISMSDALAPVTSRPADILGLPQGRLAVGAPADLVLFDPDYPWICTLDALTSRSRNSPFDGRRLHGRVEATFVDGKNVFDRQISDT